MRLFVLVYLNLVSSLVFADPIVFKAFEHEKGFIIFEVISSEYLRELQDVEAKSKQQNANMMVIAKGSKWYFGRKGAKEYTLLTPLPEFFTIGRESKIDISYQFFASSASGRPTIASLTGGVTRDPEDPTSEFQGSLEAKCEGAAVCFTFNQELTDSLSRQLSTLELYEPNLRFRKLDTLLRDPGTGDHYAVDSEMIARIDLGEPEKNHRLRVDTREVLRISADGKADFLNIASYAEPMLERALDPFVDSMEADSSKPVFVVEFENGDRLLHPPLAESDPRPLLYTGGAETKLEFVKITDETIRSLGLSNRYRSGLVDPCRHVKNSL